MIAPVREWQMGREEEIAYAREHGIPVKGGTEASPYSIDDNLWGRSSEGTDDRGPRRGRRRTTSSSSSPGPRTRPDEPQVRQRRVRGGPARSRSTASGWGWSSCSSARPRSASGTASASSTTSRTGSSGSRFATSTRCPAAAIVLTAHRELEKLVCTIHQNNFKGALESHWAYLSYAGLWLEPLRHDLDAYMDSVNELRHRRGGAQALPGLGDTGRRGARPTRCMTGHLHLSASPGGSSHSTRARGSSSSSPCRAGWPTESERRTRSDLQADWEDRGGSTQAAIWA